MMENDRTIEATLNGRRAQLQQKIERHISKIEAILEELLDGVEISKLSIKDRLLIATRFSTLYQHAISVEDSLARSQAEECESIALDFVVDKIRAEQVKANFRIIDAGVTSYEKEAEEDE